MIQYHPHKSLNATLGIAIAASLLAAATLRPARAENPVTDPPANPSTTETQNAEKKEAVKAMESWLHIVDKGDYAKSWSEASAVFRGAVSSEQWTAACGSVRGPLGQLKARKLASALYQTSVPMPGGKVLKGDFVIAQFESTYDNLKFALETVTFEKDKDGAWKASGYYIKPKL